MSSSNDGKITEDVLNFRSCELEALKKLVEVCQVCEISKSRLHAVFGEGPVDAKLMIIAEAPGAKEDEQGRPFVGRSGKLLSEMIENAIGIERENVYITNIIKCRPPDNRNPSREEASSCRPFLQKQIEIIKPKIILCLGSVSFHYLSNSVLPISKARGKVFDLGGIKLVPSFHPSYLLRNPKAKKEAFADMLIIKTLLRQV